MATLLIEDAMRLGVYSRFFPKGTKGIVVTTCRHSCPCLSVVEIVQ
jgi:hypothetical protein